MNCCLVPMIERERGTADCCRVRVEYLLSVGSPELPLHCRYRPVIIKDAYVYITERSKVSFGVCQLGSDG